MHTELSRETLIDLYVRQNLTDAEIASKFELNSWNIAQLRQKHGIAGINARQREFLRRPPSCPLSDRQQSILRGMLLGDGCLKPSGSRAYLSVSHSDKQLQYMTWIYDELRTICHNPPRQEIHHGKYQMHSLMSETREDLAQVRSILYVPHKMVVASYFEKLDDLGLAVWYMDDGSLGYINKTTLCYSLATNAFSESEQIILKTLLKSNFGIDVELRPSTSQTGKQQFTLAVTKASFDRFTDVVGRHIVPSMSYKLPGTTMAEAMLSRSKVSFSEDSLRQMYEGDRMTQEQIAIKTGVCLGTVRKHMNLWRISKRNEVAAQLNGKNSSVKRTSGGQFTSGKWSADQEALAVLLFKEIRRDGIVPKPIDIHHAVGILERLCGVAAAIDGEFIPYCRTGTELCVSFFPHIIGMASNKSLSPIAIFSDNEMLMDCIRRTIRYAKRATQASVRQGLKTYRNNRSVTIFPPVWAKRAIELSAPCGDKLKVLDFSCGFGGRMLGSYATGRVGLYVGIDPLPQNIASHEALARIVAGHASLSSRTFETKFILGCAEDEIDKLNTLFDVVLTSPPYFNKERYSDDQSQCYVRFGNYGNWVTHWLKKVVIAAAERLRDGGVMILFASDFTGHPVGTDCSEVMTEVFGKAPSCLKFVVPSVEYMRKPGVKKFETVWIATKTQQVSSPTPSNNILEVRHDTL